MTRIWMTGLATLAIASAPAHAQWKDDGEHTALSGKTVVDVGTVRTAKKMEQPPPTQQRNPLGPPPILRTTYYLAFKGSHEVCFFDDRSRNENDLAALLLTDTEARTLFLATLEQSAGGVEVRVRPVQRMNCP